MKAVILAGGLGSRIVEETSVIPKPMIAIGNKPILWHIMKIFSCHNINEFIVCCGYKGYLIKEYFANYFLHTSDVTFHLSDNRLEVHQNDAEPWTVTLVDTGEDTMTGGRLLRVRDFLHEEDAFCMTYGDGVADIDVTALIDFHRAEGRLATVTAVRPPGRYGALEIGPEQNVIRFDEKPSGDGSWINGGFFVLSPEVIDLIDDDTTSWEGYPLLRLAEEGALSAFKHQGFWQPMDTMRDKNQLNERWSSGAAPWKVW